MSAIIAKLFTKVGTGTASATTGKVSTQAATTVVSREADDQAARLASTSTTSRYIKPALAGVGGIWAGAAIYEGMLEPFGLAPETSLTDTATPSNPLRKLDELFDHLVAAGSGAGAAALVWMGGSTLAVTPGHRAVAMGLAAGAAAGTYIGVYAALQDA